MAQVPREHRRQLDALLVLDHDPKGRNLGLYVRDHKGTRIELYLTTRPRCAPRAGGGGPLGAATPYRPHALPRGPTHMTLTLNRRRAPSKGRAEVAQVLEKWAEEYVARRMEKFCGTLSAPGGPAEADPDAFAQARRCLTAP